MLDGGFSPREIAAEVGEQVVLLVRRSSSSRCAAGLVLPGRDLPVPLPLDETVPVALQPLRDPGTVELRCESDGASAAVVVRARS